MGTKTNVLPCVYITHSLQTRTCTGKHAHTHTYAHVLPLCYVKWLKVHQTGVELSIILVHLQMSCKNLFSGLCMYVVPYPEPTGGILFQNKENIPLCFNLWYFVLDFYVTLRI